MGSLALRIVVCSALAMPALVGGCNEVEVHRSAEALFVVPSSLDELSEETYFDHPYPSDLRLEDGYVRFAGYPNPRGVGLLAEYIAFMDGRLTGFSPVAAGFMRFSGAIDPDSLPDPAEAQTKQGAVQLIDVDPSSPERGTRKPIYVTFRPDEGAYWQKNTLSFMPVPGFPLRFNNRYAVVVTDDAKTADGAPLAQAETLAQVVGVATPSTGAIQALASDWAGAVKEVEAAGVSPERIVHFSVFTTNDPTAEFMAAAAALPTQIEAPTADSGAWDIVSQTDEFIEYGGSYGPTPNYQEGTVPYRAFGNGGGFVLDANGVPQIQNTFDARFALTVPRVTPCPMPEGGYPIVLYAHGTTGDYRSFVLDGTARALAEQCIATMGVDQIFHGTRPGAPDNFSEVQILFFNFLNVEAARTNVRQSGLDEIQRTRLFTESHMVVPASVSATDAEVRFDASKLMFFGHSQGSLNGPLLLAGSAAPRGAVLSGASAIMQITLLEKTKPEPNVALLVKQLFLGLFPDEYEEVSLLYPPLALAQTIVDPVDTVNYARYAQREPVFGSPKSLYITEGVGPDGTGDSYSPPRGCEALAMAFGVPIQTAVIHEPQDAAWGGLDEITIPAEGLSGNLGGGLASGVLAQWEPQGDDGHFVVFDIPRARKQSSVFLRNLADDPIGRVPAP